MNVDIVHRSSAKDAPELVLLHAFPFSSKMWETVISHLQDVTIVTTDFPGFGSAASYEWTMPDLVNDLHGSLSNNGITHPVLCGLSMGGYLAFAYYALYRDEVKGLILADTKASADTEQAKADREAYALDALARGPIAAEERQLAKMTSSWTKEHSPEIAARIKAWMYEAHPHAIANALRAMAKREDSTDLLSAISVPTLVIAGEEDAIISPDEIQQFAGKIPNATYVTIPNTGHLSAVEQPEVFAKHVQKFLA